LGFVRVRGLMQRPSATGNHRETKVLTLFVPFARWHDSSVQFRSESF
jgi:hypothetical protein